MYQTSPKSISSPKKSIRRSRKISGSPERKFIKPQPKHKVYSLKEQFPSIQNVYYPLANGGRPFRVRLEKGIAYIDKDKRWDYNFRDYDFDKISEEEIDILWDGLPLWEKFIETPYIKSFVGKEDPKYPPPCISDVGSSILLQITPTKYIYIGVGILELKFREKVQEFVTETGCRYTVDSWIYTTKNAINPLFGIKYPLSLLKKNGILRHPGDLLNEEYKRYEDNKVDIKFLHNFVL